MKLLSKLPSFAAIFASRWFIGIAVAAVVGGGAWMYGSGQLKGYQRGFERAETIYAEQIEQAINSTVERRDTQWTNQVENIYARITTILEQNERTIAEERALRRRIAELEEDRNNILSRLRDTDLGSCNLSSDFDSLFTSPEETGTTPGTTPDNGS